MTRSKLLLPAVAVLFAMLLTACGSPATTAERLRTIGEATAAAGPARFSIELDLGPLAALGLEAPEISGVVDPANHALLADVDMPEDLGDQLAPLAGLFGGEALEEADLARLDALAQDITVLVVADGLYLRGAVTDDGWVGPFTHDDAGDHTGVVDGPLSEVDVEALADDLRAALAEPLSAITDAAVVTATEVDGEPATSFSVTLDVEDAEAVAQAISGVLADLDPALVPERPGDGPSPTLPGPFGALDLSQATATLTAVVEDDTDVLRELAGRVELGSMALGGTLRLFDFGGPESLVAPADATAPDPSLWADLAPTGR